MCFDRFIFRKWDYSFSLMILGVECVFYILVWFEEVFGNCLVEMMFVKGFSYVVIYFIVYVFF